MECGEHLGLAGGAEVVDARPEQVWQAARALRALLDCEGVARTVLDFEPEQVELVGGAAVAVEREHLVAEDDELTRARAPELVLGAGELHFCAGQVKQAIRKALRRTPSKKNFENFRAYFLARH